MLYDGCRDGLVCLQPICGSHFDTEDQEDMDMTRLATEHWLRKIKKSDVVRLISP